ncbi:hypothetical protein [Streptomyces sp. NPDC048438]|uniref:hypothetical protein n=1 Tax=Streptomyces sp. NPDC048438 TaxID=3365551 RepID=UPI00370FA274
MLSSYEGTQMTSHRAPVPAHVRIGAALGLLLLSPICAEYLIGYDQIISHPIEMLTGLLVLGPLYGTVAVLIREAARRTGRGWPTMLLLSAAFGLIQAGLVDQSLFNPDFVLEASWDHDRLPTFIAELGISVKHVVGFVGGHIIWSFCAPIGVVESCVPRIADRPWLGRLSITAMIVLYGLGALVIFKEHSEQFLATPAQLGSITLFALALIVIAFTVPQRSRRQGSEGRVPPPWAVGGGIVVLLGVHQLSSPGWGGAALNITALTLAGGALLRWSRRAEWGRPHVLAACGAALVVNAALSFAVEPLGETSLVAKYGANAALMIVVLVLLGWARQRLRPTIARPFHARPAQASRDQEDRQVQTGRTGPSLFDPEPDQAGGGRFNPGPGSR